MLQEPMVVCAYGWGRMLRLYPETLEIDGVRFPLADLEAVVPKNRRFLGISSVQLTLTFQHKLLVLRGIPAQEEVQVLVEYLLRHIEMCAAKPSPSSSTVEFASAPTDAMAAIVREPPEVVRTPSPPPATLPRWLLLRKEQRERRLKRLQIERSLREYGFDVSRLAQNLQQEPLPQVAVPLRLLADEYAHYTTEATLYDEALYNTTRTRHLIKDQGTLIFTNKRVIYLGRKSQMVISYTRLLHVSCLRAAISFLAEHWSKRELFEVARPLECTMYLETILQHFRAQQAIGLPEQLQPAAQHLFSSSGYREADAPSAQSFSDA